VAGIVMVDRVLSTCPVVARELIPLMQQQGREDEKAAVFWRFWLAIISAASPYPISNGH